MVLKNFCCRARQTILKKGRLMKNDTTNVMIQEPPRRTFFKKIVAGIAGGTLLSGMTDVSAGTKTVKPKSINATLDAEPMLAELMITPYGFAPTGWALCNGQFLSIVQNSALFSLIGTYYGGNGTSNFALPNLQARVPLGAGQGNGLSLRTIGESGGSAGVTLLQTELPSHHHSLQANGGDGTSNNPTGLVYASNAENDLVFGAAGESTLGANTLSASGGGQAHNNMPPYQVFNVCIALEGVYLNGSDQYIGEIKLFPGNVYSNLQDNGWAACDGSLLPIAENEVLFDLIGTTFGGDGESTFALPDLQGRIPIGAGQGPGLSNRIIGERGGEETVTLTTNQIPAHNHAFQVSSQVGTTKTPAGNYIAANLEGVPQFASGETEGMNVTGMNNTGSSQPHENMPPFLAINYIISLGGIFPSQD